MIARYARAEMQLIWSDRRRYEVWLSIELAACSAMESLALVPAGTASAIRARAAIDVERIAQIEATTKHALIAFLTHIEEVVGEPARWLHLGMTSCDVIDTALGILCGEATALIVAELDRLRTALAERAQAHRRTPMVARTHGMHAEPTTLGLIFARWYAELGRARRRLIGAAQGITVGKLAGAVGTYAHLSPELERLTLATLGLGFETVPTQIVARDRHADLLTSLAFVGTGIEQIAATVRHWQRTEVGEAHEVFGAGQKGSSAMPHKRNPIVSENLVGLARLLRTFAQGGLEAVAVWHEQDLSHSPVDQVLIPDATTVAHFMLVRTRGLIEGLVLDTARMRQNLDSSGGLVFSEAVLLQLVRGGLPRQRAYEMVQRCALDAADSGRSFRELLSEDREIGAVVSAAALDAAFDLDAHLRFSDEVIDRALAMG